MREHLKSALLTTLILLSITLTGTLWYSSPSYEESTRGDYLSPPLGKESKPLFEITAPHQMFFHDRGNTFRLTTENSLYLDLLSKIHHNRLEQTPVLYRPTAIDWNQLYNKEEGIELRFIRGVPIETIDALFDSPLSINEIKVIDRLWITIDEETNSVQTWFISDDEEQVLIAKSKIQHLDQWFAALRSQELVEVSPIFTNDPLRQEKLSEQQVLYPRAFYIPKAEQKQPTRSYPLKKIEIKDMKNWLLDPAASRFPFESSVVYRYKNRKLTYYEKKNTMHFQDPPATDPSTATLAEELRALNSSINKHNGWTGDYHLDKIERDPNDDTYAYQFRLIAHGQPIYAPDESAPGPTTILLKGSPSERLIEYKRSLLYFVNDEKVDSITTMVGGKNLEKLLASQKIKTEQVRELFPGYRANITQSKIELEPVWVIILQNGAEQLLPAS
ncbi:two-component system activity regulator YycH [Mechercharimyces sp. CAU 1602]|uniref:two-component system activity regulator YycH n=1 Tax=Mechercharimyces sp. CAU 1602 TaxID=2973933 RepID=UPI00216236C5|nr:two-component system activity regulator YycH [Mechercharimyces sp. CAU 1602]MCS1352660.1 two-component system activity regulator YycH [Mechercharimyces sp. CAU 1602]